MSHSVISAIYDDRAGALWVGTYGGGLNKFDPRSGRAIRFREQDGLPNDVVYGILEGDDGSLWISTNKGLSRFNPNIDGDAAFDGVGGEVVFPDVRSTKEHVLPQSRVRRRG